MKDILYVSVDLGFGYVKAVGELDGKRYKIMFPSVVKERNLNKSFSNFFNSDDYIVNIKDKNTIKSYSVGEKAITDGAIRKHSDKGEFTETAIDIKVMLLTATHVLMTKFDISDIKMIDLSLGLPMGYMSNNISDELVKIVTAEKSTVTIGQIEKDIAFSEPYIFAQGIGAYYDAILDWNGNVRREELAVSSVAFIMVGYNTVELLALRMGIKGINIIEDLSDTLDKEGMNLFLTEVQNLLVSNEGVSIDVELIERAILHSNNKLETKNGIIDITNFVEQAKHTYVNNLSSNIKRRWGKNEDSLRYIYLAGASAPMLFNLLKSNFKSLILHGFDDENEKRKDACIYANANGYLKMRKAG